jgi:hypothetical protein
MMTQSVGVPFTAKWRGDLAQPQRIVERQRMRDAALVGLGRDDPDVVGELAGDRLERLQARRVDAVVIGDRECAWEAGLSIRVTPPI